MGRLIPCADSPRRAAVFPCPPSLRPPMLVPNTAAARRALDVATRQAKQTAELAALPVHHPYAAGIDVGDRSHWVCVAATPDGADPVREFPAHTAGLRQLVAWLKACGTTTVALEATGRVEAHQLVLRRDVGTPIRWRGRWLLALYHPGPRALINRPLNVQRADYERLASTLAGMHLAAFVCLMLTRLMGFGESP